MLRKKLQALFDAGRHAEVRTLLTAEGISAADRKALESFHPMFMGGLPADTEDGVGSPASASTTTTTSRASARPDMRCDHYRVVDEVRRRDLGRRGTRTDKPMTLGEFADFFPRAWR